MLLDFVVATLAAALQGMGVGSSGVLVIYLTLFGDYAQLDAQGINLIFFIFSAAAALFLHAKKRKIYLGALASLALFGAFGAAAGALLTDAIDPTVLRKIFGGMLVITGLWGFFGGSRQKKPPRP